MEALQHQLAAESSEREQLHSQLAESKALGVALGVCGREESEKWLQKVAEMAAVAQSLRVEKEEVEARLTTAVAVGKEVELGLVDQLKLEVAVREQNVSEAASVSLQLAAAVAQITGLEAELVARESSVSKLVIEVRRGAWTRVTLDLLTEFDRV